MVLNNQLYTCTALRYLYRAEHGRYTSQYSRGQKSTGSICLIDFCQLCQEETKFCNATLNDEICFLIYFGTYVNVLVYLSIVCRWFDHIGNSCLKINIKSAYGKKIFLFPTLHILILAHLWVFHVFFTLLSLLWHCNYSFGVFRKRSVRTFLSSINRPFLGLVKKAKIVRNKKKSANQPWYALYARIRFWDARVYPFTMNSLIFNNVLHVNTYIWERYW